jgi:hypothetical protein
MYHFEDKFIHNRELKKRICEQKYFFYELLVQYVHKLVNIYVHSRRTYQKHK